MADDFCYFIIFPAKKKKTKTNEQTKQRRAAAAAAARHTAWADLPRRRCGALRGGEGAVPHAGAWRSGCRVPAASCFHGSHALQHLLLTRLLTGAGGGLTFKNRSQSRGDHGPRRPRHPGARVLPHHARHDEARRRWTGGADGTAAREEGQGDVLLQSLASLPPR